MRRSPWSGARRRRWPRPQALVEAKGAHAACFVADVTDEAAVAAVSRSIAARWGAVKAVINNAGDNFRAPITALSTERWRAIVAVDLDSVFYMCRAFIPLLLKAEAPGDPQRRLELRRHRQCRDARLLRGQGRGGESDAPARGRLRRQAGLRVNTLCPGPTVSPRVRSYLERGLTSRERLEEQVLLHRLAECREIANVAAFLVSDAASFVHGATVMADGGQTVH